MAKLLKPQAGGNPKAITIRLTGRNAKNVAGQRRHDLRIGEQPAYVDDNLSHLNRVLIKPWTGAQLKKEAIERRSQRETVRAIKDNAGIAQVGIICFGTKAQKAFERLNQKTQDAAFMDIANAIADELNTSLTGLVVHRDETAIHAHFQLVGYDLNGEAVSQQTKKRHTSALQDLAADIIQKYAPMIERGRKIGERLEAGAKPHEVVNRQVRELHRDLPIEIDILRAEIEELEAKKTKVQRYIAKIENKQDRNQKEEKRLNVYEQRLDNQQSQISDREERLRELEATVNDFKKQKRKAERDAKAAEKRTADAQLLEEAALQSAQQAEEREHEAKKRTPEVLTPNRIDNLPTPLKDAIDASAQNHGYLPLDEMPDSDEKIQSTNSFLRSYLQQIATDVYQKMASTITDLRRRLRAALRREKDLKQDLHELQIKHDDLHTENISLKKELAELTQAQSTTQTKGPDL